MSDKKSQATHYTENCFGRKARYYRFVNGKIERLDVKNDRWVMAGDFVHFKCLIPISS